MGRFNSAKRSEKKPQNQDYFICVCHMIFDDHRFWQSTMKCAKCSQKPIARLMRRAKWGTQQPKKNASNQGSLQTSFFCLWLVEIYLVSFIVGQSRIFVMLAIKTEWLSKDVQICFWCFLECSVDEVWMSDILFCKHKCRKYGNEEITWLCEK